MYLLWLFRAVRERWRLGIWSQQETQWIASKTFPICDISYFSIYCKLAYIDHLVITCQWLSYVFNDVFNSKKYQCGSCRLERSEKDIRTRKDPSNKVDYTSLINGVWFFMYMKMALHKIYAWLIALPQSQLWYQHRNSFHKRQLPGKFSIWLQQKH